VQEVVGPVENDDIGSDGD